MAHWGQACDTPLTPNSPTPQPPNDSSRGQAEVIPHPCNPDSSPAVLPHLNLDSSHDDFFQLKLCQWSENPVLLGRYDKSSVLWKVSDCWTVLSKPCLLCSFPVLYTLLISPLVTVPLVYKCNVIIYFRSELLMCQSMSDVHTSAQDKEHVLPLLSLFNCLPESTHTYFNVFKYLLFWNILLSLSWTLLRLSSLFFWPSSKIHVFLQKQTKSAPTRLFLHKRL